MKPWMPFQIQSVSSWEELRRFCSQGFENLYNALNGKIGFTDNIYCQIVDVKLTGIETTVPHNLNKIPLGFIVIQQDTGQYPIINGNTPWNEQNIYLKTFISLLPGSEINAKIVILGG